MSFIEKITQNMVELTSSNLTDSVDADGNGKYFIQLEVNYETSLAWIHNTIMDKVSYNKEDVANLLDVLLKIEKRNENEIPPPMQIMAQNK